MGPRTSDTSGTTDKIEEFSSYPNYNYDTSATQKRPQTQQEAQLQAQLQAQMQAQLETQMQAQLQAQQAQLDAQQAQLEAQQRAQLQTYQASQRAKQQTLLEAYQSSSLLRDQINQSNGKSNSISYPQETYDALNRAGRNNVTPTTFNTESVPHLSLSINQIANPSLLTHQNQAFTDEIVSKVTERTRDRSNFGQPLTKGDIERIVREILFESQVNQSENLENKLIASSPTYLRYSNVPNSSQRLIGVNQNGNVLPQSAGHYPRNANSFETYPRYSPIEPLNTQVECFNCVNPHSSNIGQPIAVASANAFYPGFSSVPSDPRMVANSFSYTSV